VRRRSEQHSEKRMRSEAGRREKVRRPPQEKMPAAEGGTGGGSSGASQQRSDRLPAPQSDAENMLRRRACLYHTPSLVRPYNIARYIYIATTHATAATPKRAQRAALPREGKAAQARRCDARGSGSTCTHAASPGNAISNGAQVVREARSACARTESPSSRHYAALRKPLKRRYQPAARA